jgi:hypothetical protein
MDRTRLVDPAGHELRFVKEDHNEIRTVFEYRCDECKITAEVLFWDDKGEPVTKYRPHAT